MATITIVGAATALFAALIAFVQNDIKKVLAYSTVSQLGFMFIGVGTGVYWAAIAHLATHAFFKACLFLGAGSVMHGMGDETDIRKMGGLWKKMPHTASTFLLATLAITGFVPLAGFWTKDAILGEALELHNPVLAHVNEIAWGVGSLAALGTAFYMTRLFVLTFLGKPRTQAAEHAHESSPVMTVPLWILAAGSVAGAFVAWPFAWPAPALQNRLEALTERVFHDATAQLARAGASAAEGAIHGGHWTFFLAWGLAALGTLVAWVLYAGPGREVPFRLARAAPGAYRFWVDKFRVDELYDLLVVKPFEGLSYLLWRIVDVGIIDGFVNGVGRVSRALGALVRVFQNGDVQRYAALMALAAAIILGAALGMGGHS
jgi:NADH-quinone oxidoreductase subunit L